MNKVILALIALLLVSFPNQTQAGFSDWFGGNKKATSVQNDFQNTSSQEIELLKNEVATLKENLDILYKNHTQLVKDHNQLLQYTTELSASFKNESKNSSGTGLQRSTTISSNNLDKKVSDLQETINGICRWLFSGVSTGCPSGSIGANNRNLESRIERLERRY